jgi:hypothetical protein
MNFLKPNFKLNPTVKAQLFLEESLTELLIYTILLEKTYPFLVELGLYASN